MYQVELDLPLGLILEDSADGRFTVVEVAEGGSAEQVGVVREGDILRAFTTLGKVDNRKKQLYQQDSLLFMLVGDKSKGGAANAGQDEPGSPWRRVLAPADKVTRPVPITVHPQGP